MTTGCVDKLPLSLPQQTIVNDGHRFRVVSAGRRFGKTHLLTRELAYHARIPDQRVWAIYPSYRMAKQILWKKLKKKLLELNWVLSVNESDLTLYLKNGSEISLRSADNADSLRGVGLHFVAFDEFADMDADAFFEVIRPTLSDTNGRALFVGTPKGLNHFKDVYDMSLVDPDNWASFSYTTLDGGRVSASEVEAAKRDMDERTFRQEYMATFESYQNRIWYGFNRAQNVKVWEHGVPGQIYIGMDFNIDPMSMVVFARQGTDLYAIDEIEMYSSNTQEAVEELKQRYPRQRIWVYPDPACRQRKTSAGGATDLSILQNAGFVVKCPNSHNAVRDGINAVNSKLRSASGEVSFFIDPACKKLIECLEKHTYKPGTVQPDKDSGFDHMADAMRYAVDYMFPVRRDIDPETIRPQRWGHRIGMN